MPKKLNEDVYNRMYNNVYICMKCNASNRTTLAKVKKREASCRKCGAKRLRLKAKERRGTKS